jgi:hypothetical protein
LRAGRSVGVIVQVLLSVDGYWGMLVPEEVVRDVAVFPAPDIALHFNSPPQITCKMVRESAHLTMIGTNLTQWLTFHLVENECIQSRSIAWP